MNPGFPTQDWTVATSDGHNFVLYEDYAYVAKDGTVYILPAGGTTDGASTPSGIWVNFPPFGSYWKAAVVHDFAYRDTLMIQAADGSRKYATLTEQQSNDLLLECMDVLGTHEFTRQTIYEAVCLFGASSFTADRAAGRAAWMKT